MIKAESSKHQAPSRNPASCLLPPASSSRGYTLVELIVAVGLFALVMTLAAGAYLMMINYNRQVQGIVTGIDNLAFALETMTRTIRTGTEYRCPALTGTNCPGGKSFSVKDTSGVTTSYGLSGGVITQTKNSVAVPLTDASVTVSSLRFYTSGASAVDTRQPHVTMVVSGTVSTGSGGKTQSFTIQTGATMRGSDI